MQMVISMGISKWKMFIECIEEQETSTLKSLGSIQNNPGLTNQPTDFNADKESFS